MAHFYNYEIAKLSLSFSLSGVFLFFYFSSSLIHLFLPPPPQVFDLFDSVMLLKDGRIMWQGPTPSVVDGFGARGYPSPAHHNPADFIMK